MFSSALTNPGHRLNHARVSWLALMALCACLSASIMAEDIVATIQWQDDVEQAQQLGARHNRLILLHFWSKDCPTCEQLEQGAFRDPAFVTALHATYIPVKINVDQFPQLRRRYRIRRWPTDVVITASGDEVHRGLSRPTTRQYQSLLWSISQRQRGTRQQLSPALQNPVTRVAQVNHDQKKPAVTLVPPQITYGVPFDPTAEPAPVQPPAERQPVRVATTPDLPAETGQWRPVLPQPSTPTASPSDFAPRWIEAPRQQPAARPAARQPSGAPGEHPDRAAVLEASRQSIVAPGSRQPVSIPAARHTFANTRLGLGGHCPVTLLGTPQQVGNWVIGDRRFGIMHRDRLYLFAGAAQRDQFLQDPDQYSPVISGYDPVMLAAHHKLVDGRREYGVTYKGRIYLFSSEATLKRFWQTPDRYKSVVGEVMQATR
jgi:protein disulfide-isomerase